MNDRVRHRTRPSEPWGVQGAHGKICADPRSGNLRITPAGRGGIPAMAYVSWGDDEYCTWERLSDLIELGQGR